VTDIQPNSEKSTSLAWEIGKAILIGVGGSLLLILFLSTILHVSSVRAYIPWIIAFNGAMSGYSLVDKTRDTVRRKKLTSAMIGAAIAGITILMMVVMSTLYIGENLLTLNDVIFFLLGGVIGSELGTLLGVKYFKL